MAKVKVDYTNLSIDEILYLNAKETYYKGEPIMTDEEFDILEAKLKEEDSFVVEIVGSKKNKVDTVHLSPMLSLSKIKFKNDYVPHSEFLSFFKNINTDTSMEFAPKLDGNAINIVYQDGNLVSIASRGDGKMGQNYTTQLSNKVPNFIKDFTGEIRGEAVIDLELFNVKYSTDYKNARNFVAGILSSDYDKSLVDTYNDIDFIAFDIKGTIDNKLTTQQWLASKQFEVLDYVKYHNFKDIDETLFVQIFNEFSNYRKTSKYQLDGIVCKIIDVDIKEELGENGHHPNWALAIKFIAEEVFTKVIDIEWNMSKRGELCPVAILQPVELMGSTVQRASVFNASWMLSKKCYPGATVKLVKSGDIIPTIIDITTESSELFELPTEYNGNKLTYNGVHLLIDGFEDTKEYKSIQMYHTISTLGFKNIGPATCELLASISLSITDILSQNPEGLEMLLINSGAFKRGRELELLIENLYLLNEIELAQVIQSFGWRNCGKTISNQLANYVAGVDYDFKGLEKVVVDGFINSEEKQQQVNDLVSLLESNNIKIKMPENMNNVITYEMTGKCEAFGYSTKGNFKYEVEIINPKVKHTTLTSNTNYLVTDSLDSITGKMKKAMKNGTKICTYGEFIELVKTL